ncbi:unnamed protein product [Amoebophrya sp. A25]|nr:unnamed protein product [Amoebophrya sp. A25]|eukprot:GSA25T00013872001.1
MMESEEPTLVLLLRALVLRVRRLQESGSASGTSLSPTTQQTSPDGKTKNNERLISALHLLIKDAIAFSQNETGREKTFRFWQYFGRFLFGVFRYQPFMALAGFMSMTRKSMRWFTPIRMFSEMCEIADKIKTSYNNVDSCNSTTSNPNSSVSAADAIFHQRRHDVLTLIGVSQDWVYRLLDHVAFFERMKVLRMSESAADWLDRIIEFFWLTEIVPLAVRDALSYRKVSSEMNACSTSSSAFTTLAEQARHLRLNLIRLLFLDLPCAIYFMLPPAFRNQRLNQTWAGGLGSLACLFGCYSQWLKANEGRDFFKGHYAPLLLEGWKESTTSMLNGAAGDTTTTILNAAEEAVGIPDEKSAYEKNNLRTPLLEPQMLSDAQTRENRV